MELGISANGRIQMVGSNASKRMKLSKFEWGLTTETTEGDVVRLRNFAREKIRRPYFASLGALPSVNAMVAAHVFALRNWFGMERMGNSEAKSQRKLACVTLVCAVLGAIGGVLVLNTLSNSSSHSNTASAQTSVAQLVSSSSEKTTELVGYGNNSREAQLASTVPPVPAATQAPPSSNSQAPFGFPPPEVANTAGTEYQIIFPTKETAAPPVSDKVQ
ncbi:MAG: hypothetical protein K2X27_27005 [Candidatus Obscuribacterales bacterium]|nr:hypothetical protein [Candidatus Obscuribacterales bacterium]